MGKAQKEFIIYSNEYGYLFSGDNIKDAKETLYEQYVEENNENDVLLIDEVVADNEIEEYIYFQNGISFEDFQYDMKDFIEGSATAFIVVGRVGRWNGNFKIGGVIQTHADFCQTLRNADGIVVKDIRGHLYVESAHHDGVNYYEIKELTKKGYEYFCNDDSHDNFKDCNSVFESNFFTKLPRYTNREMRHN